MGEKRRGFGWELTASVVGSGNRCLRFGAASGRQADWGGVRYFLRQQQDFCCQVERLRVLLETSHASRTAPSASAGAGAPFSRQEQPKRMSSKLIIIVSALSVATCSQAQINVP